MIHPILISTQWFEGGAPAGPVKLRRAAGVHARLGGMGREDLDKARGMAREMALPLAVVEVTGDVNQVAQSTEDIKRFAGFLSQAGVMAELSLASTGTYDVAGAPRADTRAGEILRGVVGAFSQAGVGVSLRHRAGHWMERVQDSVRVLMRVNRAEFGVVLSVADWLEVDATGMEDRLHLALPRLTNVVVNNREAGGDYPGVKGLLERLAGMGYVGPVTVEPRAGERGLDGLKGIDW